MLAALSFVVVVIFGIDVGADFLGMGPQAYLGGVVSGLAFAIFYFFGRPFGNVNLQESDAVRVVQNAPAREEKVFERASLQTERRSQPEYPAPSSQGGWLQTTMAGFGAIGAALFGAKKKRRKRRRSHSRR